MTSPSPFLRHIHSDAEFKTLINDKPVVLVDFYKSWCPPCNAILPYYSELADKYKTITFAKVNMEKVPSLSKRLEVTASPTFILFKNKVEVDRLRGADPRSLDKMVTENAPKADPSGAGEASSASQSDISLLEYLEMGQVNCLNENPEHTLQSIVSSRNRNINDAYLESDADEQLLINLPFNQVVRIRSLVLQAKDPKKGPKNIKIAINKPALGFDDIENAQEPQVVQVFEVPEDMVKEGKHIHLRFVRLQRVNSLHIFVSSNQGDEDETRIDAIDVFGQPVATTQMSGLKRTDDA